MAADKPTFLCKAEKRSADVGEVIIYSDIGQSWFGEGLTAKDFDALLKEVKGVSQLDVRINSGGGDVFDGITIYNRLRSFPASKTVYVDGLAASIASVIMLAGDKIIAYDTSTIMVHLPWTFAMGNEDDLADSIRRLGIVKDAIVTAYTSRTELTEAKALELMRAETWLTADQAKQYGFVTSVETSARVAASIDKRPWFLKEPPHVKPNMARARAQQNRVALRMHARKAI